VTQTILFSVLVLGTVAAVFAAILYLIAQKFAVEEDPRVTEVAEMLPGINCGACGFPGCPGMAAALVEGCRRRGHLAPAVSARRAGDDESYR
jgi:electron transport complex protein RnfB